MKLSPSAWKKKDGKKSRSAFENNRQALAFHPPPIWFKPRKKNGEDKDGKKSDKKDEYKEIDLRLDPSEKKSETIKKKILILRDPDPEAWIKWQQEIEEVYVGAPVKEPRKKALLAPQFLAGPARDTWKKCYAEVVATHTPEES